MLKNPTVSIVIPFKNAQRYLSTAIESCINQTFRDIEVICVDDHSTDDSCKVVRRYTSDPRVRIISSMANGASAARNAGVLVASGAWIIFLDADDYLHKEKVQEHLREVERSSDAYAIYVGRYINVYESGSFEERYQDIFEGTVGAVDWIKRWALGEVAYPPSVHLVRASFVRENEGWREDLSYNDDSEYFIRLYLNSRKLKYCENAISYYRREVAGSLGSRRDLDARRSELVALNAVVECTLQADSSLMMRWYLAHRYSRYIYSLYPAGRDLLEEAEKRLNDLKVDVERDWSHRRWRHIRILVGWKGIKRIQVIIRRLCSQ